MREGAKVTGTFELEIWLSEAGRYCLVISFCDNQTTKADIVFSSMALDVVQTVQVAVMSRLSDLLPA